MIHQHSAVQAETRGAHLLKALWTHEWILHCGAPLNHETSQQLLLVLLSRPFQAKLLYHSLVVCVRLIGSLQYGHALSGSRLHLDVEVKNVSARFLEEVGTELKGFCQGRAAPHLHLDASVVYHEEQWKMTATTAKKRRLKLMVPSVKLVEKKRMIFLVNMVFSSPLGIHVELLSLKEPLCRPDHHHWLHMDCTMKQKHLQAFWLAQNNLVKKHILSMSG